MVQVATGKDPTRRGMSVLGKVKSGAGGKVGGKATVASHGEQVGNGGKVGGLATKASHGDQLAMEEGKLEG